ncbi:MAG: hypothetical protein HC937_02990 [Aquincola sp.]|nr:hypothetical protein [Aquincola sp.]
MLEGLAKTLKDILPDAADGYVDKALGAINDPAHGGLSGVVEKFRANGLGDIAAQLIGWTLTEGQRDATRKR